MKTVLPSKWRWKTASVFIQVSGVFLDLAAWVSGADRIELTSFDKAKYPDEDLTPKIRFDGGEWFNPK